jgi:cell wall-associated NlpC family hydrolase
MIRTATAFMFSVLLHAGSCAAEPLYAVALTRTPVLNTPDFRSVFGGRDGKTLQKDECGQLRSLEFVALPGTVFRVDAESRSGQRKIYRVQTADYPYPSRHGYFVDAGSVRLHDRRPPERAASLPTREKILAALKKRVGSRYVWGGNAAGGVAELLSWYPPAEKSALGDADRKIWMLAGVDCSGLLYEATDGATPRNTSALLTFGTSVSAAGKSRAEITASLEPLDLIVWPGHVLIMLDGGEIIESRLDCREPGRGVRIRPVAAALEEIMKRRRPADALIDGKGEFVIRRWFGASGRTATF